ncbi:MAG TPA: Ig-like domain repeat protein, partial [Usitatibacter sp.]|nr:Ig-like domain repeat protein [Usitatibacter sp.]
MRTCNFLAAAALAVAGFAFPAFAQSTWPPTPPVKLAVNPITNKVYVANASANTVTAFNATTGTSTTIAVGSSPEFIAVNPATNRVYVDNTRDASLSVIDGATDTLVGTLPIGSSGPISVNPVTNIIYIVRLTGTGSDEVTFLDGATDNSYTIATNSFQPNAMAVNPVTNRIYVTHYATGDVRVISGAFNPADDFPASTSIGTFSHPFAIVANPVTNKVYVITQDSRGPVGVIDGAGNGIVFPAVAPGHAIGPQAIALNPVTNRIYAAFANEVVIIDGGTNALTYVPIQGASSGGIALAINYATNKVFAATALGTLNVIDGDTNAVTSSAIPAGTSAVGVNPLTDAAYLFDTALTSLAGTGGPTHAIPLTTSIVPFSGNTTKPSATLTLNAASGFSPSALPVRKVYYQIDSLSGPWLPAAGTGPFSASFAGLADGPHTIHAFAVDGQDAPLATGPQASPLVGTIASYTFTVSSKVAAAVSLASSTNPSRAGQAVTFTASITGAAGVATGTVAFRDGATPIAGCGAVAVSSGVAHCTTSALTAGSHPVTAQYSGDAQYNAASATLTQAVDAKADANLAVASSANPASAGGTVTFTVTVSGNAGAATGTATFLADGASLAGCVDVALASGSATCSTAALAPGGHAMTVRYSGDANYLAATSAPLAQSVNAMGNALQGLSTRMDVLTGDNVLIGGFVIGGASP